MNFNKRVNGSWVDTPHYIHNTSTDTLTTLPAVLYPNAVTATVGLKGNMEQNGTPTPQNPIQPSETGDETANLCDESNLNQGYYNTTVPFAFTADTKYRCFSLNLSAGKYSILVYGSNIPMRLLRVSSNSMGIGYVSTDNEPYTFDLTVSETVYITFRNINTTTDFSGLSVMMNAGDTVLPHEPHGIKIPISSGGVTTTEYLGQVQSTRNIAKYEFTGQEDWTEALSGTNNHFFQLIQSQVKYVGLYEKCTHFICTQISSNNTDIGFCVTSGGGAFRIRPENTATSTLTTFKQWLADQSTAGTPVTVWYVLATPTTGIVNEPIRKIGDYADTVSGISIPTTAGANSFDVLTTLKPSEVTVNYKGWHPVQSVHERESGAWT